MDKKTILENISKKSKVAVAELEKEFETIFNGLPPSDDREKQALKQLNNNNVGGGEDKTEDVELILLGVRQLTDFNAKTVAETLKKYESNKVEMLESGKVKLVPVDPKNPDGDKEPIVIDLQETFQFNGEDIKNPTFGKPMGHKYNSNTLVLARKPGDKEWVVSSLALRDEFATGINPQEMLIPMTVNCLGTIADGLKTARSTKLLPFDEEINVSQLIAQTCGDHVQELKNVFEYTKTLDMKDYDRFVVTSGTLQYCNKPKVEGQSYNGSIDDLETSELITVFIDPRLGEPKKEKDYTFICQPTIKPKKDKNKQPTGEDQVILNVMGYY